MKNKKITTTLILVLFSVAAFAQTFTLDLDAKMIKSNGPLKKGEDVKLVKFTHETVTSNGANEVSLTPTASLQELFYLEDSRNRRVEVTSRIDDCFKFQYKGIQDFWDSKIITNVLYRLKKKGFQYSLRREMEDDALEYIQKVKNSNLELNDPYLECYIYSLIAKIAPTQLIDGRPCSINILIQDNPSINACCYPNGTIVINTGLLAALHSEDELVAILTHEIAHFILDHSVQNVNAAITRQKRAEFWAAFATGLTAVAEGYIAANNSYYIPGAATLSMAMISSSIASQVIDRLGMNYNYEQEYEADQIATEALGMLGYDKNALSTALSRLENEYIKERNNAIYLNSYSHPALISRINSAGIPSLVKSKKFEQTISFAVSSVAMMKYFDRRFRQCLPLVNQNIDNNVATADDYILKANCLLSLQNDRQSNNEVLDLINMAKDLDPDNLNIYKVEIIATLRQDDISKATKLLNQYIFTLDSYSLDNIKSSRAWEQNSSYIASEKNWADKMIIKLRGM